MGGMDTILAICQLALLYGPAKMAWDRVDCGKWSALSIALPLHVMFSTFLWNGLWYAGAVSAVSCGLWYYLFFDAYFFPRKV